MNELIKVNYDSDRPTVMGRDLHEFLEVETPYHIWFPRMCEYGFIENIDFMTFEQKCTKPQGGRPSTDHQLTIDMAKELCMIQRTEKGKQARQYFISLEKAWNTPEMVMARALKMADTRLMSMQNKVLELTTTIENQKPKVLFAEAVTTSHTTILVGELAKILKQNGVVIGQNRMFEWLRENDYLIKRKGTDYNMPTQKSMELGLFEIRERTINNPNGSIMVTKTPKVTGKGQIYFVNKFKQAEVS